jgi:NADH-quinone oxidoreductase subunit L
MAGPTPVSALIHAATMVTAGVYLITRLNPIMAQAGWANDVIAWTGAITALVAATIAVAQTDIKKVLAYSTVSQLGYMFMAVGTQTYVAGVFHMITHAFFKALLFLGAGAVIYSMAHEQDMRRYGNLRKYLPVTFVTFFIGWLAIAGVPPLSGFWSKDEILAGVFNYGAAGPALWTVGVLTALLTAFYMTRQLIMTFFGPEQWREVTPVPAAAAVGGSGAGAGDTPPEHEAESPTVQLGEGSPADPAHTGHDDHTGHGEHHLTPDHEPKEAPWTMLAPLVVLAGMAAIAGLMNLPFSDQFKRLEHWLYPMIVFENPLPEGPTLVGLAAVAIVTAVVGIWFGFFVYLKRRLDPARIELPILAEGWKIDSTYAAVVGGPGEATFQGIADADARIVDGAVNAVGRGSLGLGSRLRKLQSGLVRTYALAISIGTIALLAFIVTRMNL